jgi:hypothetical protein
MKTRFDYFRASQQNKKSPAQTTNSGFGATAIVLFTFLGLCAGNAGAANIVQDPGFESANSGYVNAPNYLSDGVWQVSANSVLVLNSPANCASGSRCVDLAPIAQATTLQQALSTVAGQSYDLSFDIWNSGQPPITVKFGSQTETVGGHGSWTLVSFDDLIAPSSNTILSFTSANGDDFLDNVSVTPSTAPTPELATILLVGSALLAGGIFRRRNRYAAPRQVESLVGA